MLLYDTVEEVYVFVTLFCQFILISTDKQNNLCLMLTLTVTQGKLSSSDVCCLCSARQNLERNCYNSKTFTFEIPFYDFHVLYASHSADFEGNYFVLFIITMKSFFCILFYSVLQDRASTQEENSQALGTIPWQSTDIIGQWCCLTYDDAVYLGVTQDMNETHVNVKCWKQLLFLATTGRCVVVFE